jgi:hypothetical protein
MAYWGNIPSAVCLDIFRQLTTGEWSQVPFTIDLVLLLASPSVSAPRELPKGCSIVGYDELPQSMTQNTLTATRYAGRQQGLLQRLRYCQAQGIHRLVEVDTQEELAMLSYFMMATKRGGHNLSEASAFACEWKDAGEGARVQANDAERAEGGKGKNGGKDVEEGECVSEAVAVDVNASSVTILRSLSQLYEDELLAYLIQRPVVMQNVVDGSLDAASMTRDHDAWQRWWRGPIKDKEDAIAQTCAKFALSLPNANTVNKTMQKVALGIWEHSSLKCASCDLILSKNDVEAMQHRTVRAGRDNASNEEDISSAASNDTSLNMDMHQLELDGQVVQCPACIRAASGPM